MKENGEKTGRKRGKSAKISEGRRFSSEYQPAKNGRKKDFLKDLKKEYDLSSSDYKIIVLNILSMSQDELTAAFKDREKSALETLIISAVLNAFSSGNLQTLETLLNRTIGKPLDVMITGNLNNTEGFLSAEDEARIKNEYGILLGGKDVFVNRKAKTGE